MPWRGCNHESWPHRNCTFYEHDYEQRELDNELNTKQVCINQSDNESPNENRKTLIKHDTFVNKESNYGFIKYMDIVMLKSIS